MHNKSPTAVSLRPLFYCEGTMSATGFFFTSLYRLNYQFEYKKGFVSFLKWLLIHGDMYIRRYLNQMIRSCICLISLNALDHSTYSSCD